MTGLVRTLDDILVAASLHSVAIAIAGHEDHRHLRSRGIVEQAVADRFGIHVRAGFIQQDEVRLRDVETVEGIGPSLGDKNVSAIEMLG